MPTRPRPIAAAPEPNTFAPIDFSRSLSRSWAAGPIVQQSLERDIEATSDDEAEYDSEDESPFQPLEVAASAPATTHDFSLSAWHRRSSFGGPGNRAAIGPALHQSVSNRDRLPREERQRIVEEERSLLRDNNL